MSELLNPSQTGVIQPAQNESWLKVGRVFGEMSGGFVHKTKKRLDVR